MKNSATDAYRGRSFQFTEARVAAARRAARPDDADAQGRRSWRDEGCKGLTLVVNIGSGTAAYYFVGKAEGQTTRRALGDVDVVTLQEARQIVNRFRFDRTVAAVVAPRAEAEADVDTSPTVKEVADAMIEAHTAGRWLPGGRSRPPTDRTMKFYRDLRRAQLAKHEGMTLEEFAEELATIYGKLQSSAPVQANRFLQLVRNVYAYAAAVGQWTGPNPTAGQDGNRLTRTPEKARERTLTDEEWRRLDKSMAGEPLSMWRDLFTMSMLTLQRMGAVTHMRWSDLTLAGQSAEWRIPAKWMKGRKSGHVVPLSQLPAALAILRDRKKAASKGCPWVFPAAEGDDGPARNYDKAWKRILERAELWSEDPDRRPRPHDLRRTGGARMTAAGVPLQTVTRALGDAPSSAGMVARVYAQVVDEALRDAFAAAARKQPKTR